MIDPDVSPAEQERQRRWLAGLLMRRDSPVLPRFTSLMEQLAARPRAWRRQVRRRLAVTATGAALLLALAGFGARAAPTHEITVVDGEIAVSKNGICSLIEAINNANDTEDGQRHPDCAAGNPEGADTIVLPTGGTFNVSKSVNDYYGYSALPLITSAITVEGNGSTITRTGRKDMRFFTIAPYYADYSADLTLNDLTLTNGKNEYYNGGAIYAYMSALTLNNCTITGNAAGDGGGALFAYVSDVIINGTTLSDNTAYSGGAIGAVYGTLTITDSLISGNNVPNGLGGGLYLTGTEDIVLTNVTVQGNKAAYGAGIAILYGTATLTGSVITGNESGPYKGGGGLYLAGSTTTLTNVQISNNVAYQGGGLFVYSGETTVSGSTLANNEAKMGGGFYAWQDSVIEVTNTTLSGNQAGTAGGGAAGVGAMVFTNVTLSGNSAGATGGGLHLTEGAMTLRQTLLAGNTAPTGPEAHRQSGTLNAESHNLFGFNGNAGLSGFSPGATDIVPGAGTTLAAVLGPLADNTGPTWTHALPPGSPAIDRVANDTCAAAPVSGVDQRGLPRNANGNGAASASECDIGAYEYQPGGPVDTPTPTATSEASPTPSATPTDGPSPTPTTTPTVSPTPTDGPSPTPTATTDATPGPDGESAFLPVVVNQP